MTSPTDTIYGREFDANDWPHGLRCLDCDRKLEDGDRYATRLQGFAVDGTPVTEIICLECALAVTP
jgi:hypothetical protein